MLQKKTVVDNLLSALDEVHKDVSERRTKSRQSAIERHNLRINTKTANFSIGDFVLVAKQYSHDGPKLRMKWIGPQRVTKVISNSVFEYQDILNEFTSLILANCLKFYADSELNVKEELLHTIDHNNAQYNVVPKLLDLHFNSDE